MASTGTNSSLSHSFTEGRCVTVHALEAGTLTLPASQFVEPCEPGARLTKPSLSFLIQHTSDNGQLTRVIFDLGIRRIISEYPPELQTHLLARQPLSTHPDVRESIQRGGLKTENIDIVILSHVHWDHVGRPKDFQQSLFVVGNGALELLRSGAALGSVRGSHSHFEPDLLPLDRSIELPSVEDVARTENRKDNASAMKARLQYGRWEPLLHFPAAIDVFGDKSLFIVNAPGHLQGHINLLARIAPNRWIYLAGDACHDRRLLTGELNIAEWNNEQGATCCIHVDKAAAKQTLGLIRELEVQYEDEVEVILAHDDEWSMRSENKGKFWPGRL